MELDEKSLKDITIHPVEDVDVCTKLHSNYSKVWDISLKTANVNLIESLVKKSGDHHNR